jgi:hypothetical protein
MKKVSPKSMAAGFTVSCNCNLHERIGDKQGILQLFEHEYLQKGAKYD